MNKKLIAFAVAGLGFGAIQGCSVEQGAGYESEDVGVTESALAGAGSLVITSDWGTGFCADMKLTNGLPEATSKWRVIMDLKTTVITGGWSFNILGPDGLPKSSTGATGIVTMVPVDYNTNIAPGQTVTYGFCSSAPSAAVRPVMKAWNTSTMLYAECATAGGANPTKAALAVAMAKELGRFDPVADLTITNNMVALKSALTATGGVCGPGKCVNTKGILSQQADGATADQTVFNPTNFKEDLKASFGRHTDNINNLNANNKPALPIAHKLTLVSGPTNIGQVQNGVSKSCGPHYVFKVTKADGSNLSTTERNNLGHATVFFGGAAAGQTGSNPYVGYTTTGLAACPSGASCIAIDPTDGDNTTTSTTSAGSAPTYPMNRVLDPTNALLNTACITTLGKYGTLQPKPNRPDLAGYLYCTP